ncbi:HNH endonuclease signature motif containing protein [Sphaerotilus sp.]|uniref:HNH endonuclease n=1 Tax=Sphaerotilus sp. TaxID=2093942 RepID=UPI002ACE9E12|nr:HNH endonuclease signature motif containing protein [Sphaerotilus sp.]MDZ7858329.1 HNH endonuclease signature motif containing protein [Sphaerotilus sp.]
MTKWDPEKVSKDSIFRAALIWDEAGYRNFRNSKFYDVIIDGKPYPPKAICSCAYELSTGILIATEDYGGAKEGTFHRRLKDLGFLIVEKRSSEKFYDEVCLNMRLSSQERLKLIAKNHGGPPQKTLTQVYRYVRSSLVVAERLFLANGKCEECGKKAPFKRKKDGSPYLEVHHIKPLSRNGLDTVENTKAVCPNCHCEIHDLMGVDI